MKTQKTARNLALYLRPLILLVAGATAMLTGACRNDGELSFAGEMDCRNYCEHRKDCNDNTDVDNCIDNCIDRMSNCQADEQQQALDQLAGCQDVACNDFVGCAIEAGATCYFGL
jgi:hypothetical protein